MTQRIANFHQALAWTLSVGTRWRICLFALFEMSIFYSRIYWRVMGLSRRLEESMFLLSAGLALYQFASRVDLCSLSLFADSS